MSMRTFHFASCFKLRMTPVFNRKPARYSSYRSYYTLCMIIVLLTGFALFAYYTQKYPSSVEALRQNSLLLSSANKEPIKTSGNQLKTQGNSQTGNEHFSKSDEESTNQDIPRMDQPTKLGDRRTTSTLKDATRQINLDLDIASGQRLKFMESCPILTPINFCAELARTAQLERCSPSRNCRDRIAAIHNKTIGISKQAVEDVVRKGIGLHQVATQISKSNVFFENGMSFSPQTSQNLASSSINSSNSKTDYGNLKSTHSDEPPTLLPSGSLNVEESTEIYVTYDPDTFFENRSPKQATVESRDRKIILWYSPTRYWPKTPGLLQLRGCPDFLCYVTIDKRWSKRSSAMIFASDVTPQWPPLRRPDQVFVFQNHEPPNDNFFDHRSPLWTSAFNWTMTYRHDSDIVRPYGLVRLKRVNETTENGSVRLKDYGAILRNKTKLVAAMLSNCGASSRRDDYIRELSRYIPIDVFGSCGNKQCPRGDDNKCFKEISANYKFFLAFESSMCEDYITEKFFRFFNMDLILVASGSNQYHVHAPKETFINTADYKSPKHLALRLKYLDTHTEDYVELLRTKSQYTALFQDWTILDQSGLIKFHHYAHDVIPLCQVCQRLWNLEKYSKIIPDIKSWVQMKMCRKKEEIDDIGK